MFSKATHKPKMKRRLFGREGADKIAGIFFFIPFGVLFLLFTVIPVITAIVLSFTNYTVLQEPITVWFKNYVYLFTEDDTFILALRQTLTFALFSGPIGYIVSFMVAWAIDTLKFKKFYALAFYAPSITSGIAMSVIWLFFFAPDRLGLINNLLLDMGAISDPILWTQNPEWVLFLVVFVSVWMGMGNGFLGFLAGFQNMDREVFEAGAIDGVTNKFQELIYLVLPLMKPMLLFGAVNTIAGSFGIYDIPLTLVGFPGPDNSAITLVGHLNDFAFNRMDFGYACTIAVIMFAMTFLLGRVVFKLLDSKDE